MNVTDLAEVADMLDWLNGEMLNPSFIVSMVVELPTSGTRVSIVFNDESGLFELETCE